MKMLTPEELADLRAEIALAGYPEAELDDLIRLVDSIVVSFIDQDFGWNSIQNTLSSHANYAFKTPETRGNLRDSGISGPVDLDCEGAKNSNGPERQLAP